MESGPYRNNFEPYLAITSVADAWRALRDREDLWKANGFKGRSCFRGEENYEFWLRPAIARNSGWLENERNIIYDAHRFAPNEFASMPDIVEGLIKMQRYGIPTRMLAVTFNLLVGLFFACRDGQDKKGRETDGAFYIIPAYEEYVSFRKIYAQVCASVALFSPEEIKESKELDEENLKTRNQNYYELKINHIIKCLSKYNKDVLEYRPKLDYFTCTPYFLKPSLSNKGVFAEDECFVLFKGIGDISYRGRGPTVASILGENKYRVAAECKERILAELNELGISESTLFPDRAHAVPIFEFAAQIKKKYERADDSSLS